VAAEEFAQAGAAWAAYHRRGELRCGWAAAESLRRAGDVSAAVAGLTAVEQTATDLGAITILARIHRSLRAAGERRSAGRASGGDGLTARERQVLELVGAGLTNAQIASRLGIARRTVVALITSASGKLGAQNRNQAASLVARS
jgi:DNA-binding CsgD family transcriptional regulator